MKHFFFRKILKNNNQGPYNGQDTDERKTVKKWVCPNDETENVGPYCIICGTPTPENKPQNKKF